MSERIARRRTLFTVPADAGCETKLLGSRCSSGHVLFPAQPMGCEVCGAFGEEIESVELDAAGRLRSFAVSRRERRPGSTMPLIVGSVELDAGPVVEVVLDIDEESVLSRGQRVTGHLVEIAGDESGSQIIDCFFAPAESSRAVD